MFPSLNNKTDNIMINYLKRFSFINLFISFQQELNLRQETLYLCINIFDRYVQKKFIENKLININEDLNKIAITCLFIASKYEEIYPPFLKEFIDIYRHKYTKREIFIKEDEILSELDFQVIIVTSLLFLKIFCQSDDKCEDKQNKDIMGLCFNCAQFLLEICLIEPKFCELKPSLQAALCLYLARKFILSDLKIPYYKIWTYDLTFKTNYSEIQIKKNLKIALNIIKNFFGNVYTKNFMAMPLYIKYYTTEYSRISLKLKKIINGE